MKKSILIILFSFTSLQSYSQYSVIYSAWQNRSISEITAFTNSHNNNLAFYISILGIGDPFLSPYWTRYNKNTQSFDTLPNHGYLMGSYCIGPWGFGTSGIGKFVISNSDTNLILGIYYEGPCSSPEGNAYNLISFNTGQNSYNPLSSQNGVMNSFDIDPTSEYLIYGVGSQLFAPAKFWRSTDKGSTWSSNIFLNTNPYTSYLKVNPLSRNEIYLFISDTLRKSSDFGQSFVNKYRFQGVNSMTIDNVDGSVYIASSFGLYKSTSGGSSFELKFNLHCNKLLIDPDNHNILYLGVFDEGIYKSVNAGSSWIKYFDAFEGYRNALGIIKYKNDGDTIYVANNKKVYKIWDRLVGINSNQAETADQFYLYQNYPNPFNPETKISYSVPSEQFVKLHVYDATGKKLMTLVNEVKPAGRYEITFNAASLSSGIYFYKIETKAFTEVKRMMLIK